MEDLVSIIIPVYNREKLIKETIDSVKRQTWPKWELVLVDDNSVDGSLEVMRQSAERDPRIKVYKRPMGRNAGGNASRNFGFERSKGAFINWFDSDDIMHPQFIEKKVKAFKDNGCDVIFSRTIRTDFREDYFPDNRLKKSDNFLEDYILRKISWYLPDAMLKRTFIEGKILFDETLLAGQDRDFFIRLFAQKLPKFEIIDLYGTYYRTHKESISEKLYRQGNVKMQTSHYFSLLNQLQVLRQNQKLSPTLEAHYLEELKKRLPAIVRSNFPFRPYLKNLISLSGFNKTTLKVWSQVFPAYISFITFGKGERFLK